MTYYFKVFHNKILFNHFRLLFLLHTHRKHQETLVFWYFPKIQKDNISMKWVYVVLSIRSSLIFSIFLSKKFIAISKIILNPATFALQQEPWVKVTLLTERQNTKSLSSVTMYRHCFWNNFF